MRMRYPRQHIVLLDAEDGNHNSVPGAWRHDVNLDDVYPQRGGNVDLKKAKQQKVYPKHYRNQPVGAVAWQVLAVDS